MTSRRGTLASTTDSGMPILVVRDNTPISSTTESDGEYAPLTCNSLGAVRTAPSTDAFVEIGVEQNDRVNTWSQDGYNGDIDVGTETIWPVGGSYIIPTTAETLEITSSSTADDGLLQGTGAWFIQLIGISATRKRQVETLILRGTTTVSTSNTWLGVNVAHLRGVGTGTTNAGNITIVGGTSDNTYAYIEAGRSISRQLIFHSQLQTKVVVPWVRLNVLRSGSGAVNKAVITFIVDVYDPTLLVKRQELELRMDTSISNVMEYKPLPYTKFLSDDGGLVFVARVTSTTADTVVNAQISFVEVLDADYTL